MTSHLKNIKGKVLTEERKKKITRILPKVLLGFIIIHTFLLISAVILTEMDDSFLPLQFKTVLSDSMSDTFSKGDLIALKRYDDKCELIYDSKDYHNNSIISYYAHDSYGQKYLNTHRIVSYTTEENEILFYTQGDNRTLCINYDSGCVRKEDIQYVYLFKMHGLGNLVNFTKSPTALFLFVLVPLTLLMLMYVSDNFTKSIKDVINEENS